jgi:hypothetical protein
MAVRLGADGMATVQLADRAARRAKVPADWARVATLLKTAIKKTALPIENYYQLAVACRKSGDAVGYKATCAGITKQLPPPGTPMGLTDAINAARAFALGSGATDDWTIPLLRVDRILARIDERGATDPSWKERDKPTRQLFVHLRGALLVRAGQSKEATEALRDPASLFPLDSEFANWVYLALAEHALGRADKAKAAAARARAIRPTLKDDKAWERAEDELLAAELDAVLPRTDK